jgi:trans-aconitate methyltransferase
VFILKGELMSENKNQTWNPEQYARNARFVADLAAPVVELLAPQAGERILDLGCGDGHLTAKLATLGCSMVGVDSSAELIAATQKLGLDARLVDARSVASIPGFIGAFDAVFTNATLHWIKQSDLVIHSVAQVLKPMGRFVGEFGGENCVARIRWALGEALARRGHDIATQSLVFSDGARVP